MSQFNDHGMSVRVASRWLGGSVTPDMPPAAPPWTGGPSHVRVAALYLAYRERKKKTKEPEVGWKLFFKEVGTKTVTSPLTGKKVKITTLKSPEYREDPPSQALLNKLYKEWREKRQRSTGAPGAPAGEPPAAEEPTSTEPAGTPPAEEPKKPEEAPPAEEPKKPEETPPAPKKPKRRRHLIQPKKPTPAPGEAAPKKPEEAPPAPGDEEAKPEEKPEEKGTGDEPVDVKPEDLVPEPDILDIAGKPPEGSKPSVVNDVVQQAAKGKAPARRQVGEALSLVVKALTGNVDQISEGELAKLTKLEAWLRDLAGMKDEEPKLKRKIPKLRLRTLSPEVAKITKKYGIKDKHLKSFRDFVEESQRQEAEASKPAKKIKAKHSLSDDDVKSASRVAERARKKHQTAAKKHKEQEAKYEKALSQYETDKKEVEDIHSDLTGQLKKAGLTDGDFEGIREEAKRLTGEHEKAMTAWKAESKRAKERGRKPPPKPEPPDVKGAWMKKHRERWEADTKGKKDRGEYKPPEIADELFTAVVEAPDAPEKPKKPEKPKEPTGKDIRDAIAEEDPDLAATLKDLSDEEVGTLTTPPRAKTLAEKKKDFIANTDDPDLKERVQDMDVDDFEELLGGIMGESGGRRRGSLRERTIRLAYARPDLREPLLAALDERGR